MSTRYIILRGIGSSPVVGWEPIGEYEGTNPAGACRRAFEDSDRDEDWYRIVPARSWTRSLRMLKTTMTRTEIVVMPEPGDLPVIEPRPDATPTSEAVDASYVPEP
jgi:hypothetical protein